MNSLNLSPDDVSFSNLKGKVAVITGGSSGIGLATAKLFSAHGAKILICDLQEPLEQIRGSVFAKCNVAIWADLLAVFDLAVATFGAVDILVANAGVGGSKADFFQDEFDGEGRLKEPPTEVLDVNLKGVLMSVKIAIHEFKKSGKGGRIVMTASTAGLMGEMHLPVYSATKHGVIGLMRALRNTAAKFNISINCVAPWVTETNLLQPGLRDRLAVSKVPIQKAESVATAIAYSVTAESWTGKTIFCCDDTFTEVEGPILELLPQWLGEENARLWNNAQETPYFVSKSGL